MALDVNSDPVFLAVSIIFTLQQVEGEVQLPGLSLASLGHERAQGLRSSRTALEIAPDRYHPSYPGNER